MPLRPSAAPPHTRASATPPLFFSGASLIGMILWPRAKRSISPAVARQIGVAARVHGAEPVAVFVDEDAATIER